MTSWLPHDVQSLLPRSSPHKASLAAPGDAAPQLPSNAIVVHGQAPRPFDSPSLGTIVAFVRHCGCPFAEKEVRLLGEVRKKYDDSQVQIVIVQHSSKEETLKWWNNIGEPIKDATILIDPEREIYSAFGIGVLGWGGLFSMNLLTQLQDLRKEGIVNTKTGGGSWRWSTSGGLAIDQRGIVKWSKEAQSAEQMCPYDTEVVQSLTSEGR
ncbi:unnamed protein product [Parajaminaea phylloscopi]